MDTVSDGAGDFISLLRSMEEQIESANLLAIDLAVGILENEGSEQAQLRASETLRQIAFRSRQATSEMECIINKFRTADSSSK